MSTVRWGIAGPGRMAEVFVKDFGHVPDAELVAVGSRSLERAQAFADEHGIARAHGSYADLCADPEVDVVYIATPHPQHKAIALAAIAAGKGVVVEKAFTATLAGATEVVEAARAAQVFCMEGMWTRFQPVIRRMHEIVDAGEIGTLTAVMGDLFAHREFVPDDRLFDPAKGGGSMLDLGVYVTHFAQDFLGNPSEVQTRGRLYENGVDAQVALLLDHESGAQASLMAALQAPGPGRQVVIGTGGWIEVEPRFHHPRAIIVHRNGREDERIELEPDGLGYAHEIAEVTRCIQQGLTESPLLSLDDTLSVMATMEQGLSQLGVSYTEAD